MTNPEIGEQSIVQESGNKIEIVALILLGITAGFFCWFLYTEHFDSKAAKEQMVELQQKAYERMVFMDLQQRFGDA